MNGGEEGYILATKEKYNPRIVTNSYEYVHSHRFCIYNTSLIDRVQYTRGETMIHRWNNCYHDSINRCTAGGKYIPNPSLPTILPSDGFEYEATGRSPLLSTCSA